MGKLSKLFVSLFLFGGVANLSAKTEQVHATFANPSPTNNATWNADTKTMGWTAGWSNQLRNIGLPSGDVTKYKKLVVDCEIKSGEQFRILFYKGGSNKTLYASNGLNEFILADTLKALFPDDYNEYLLACDEICLSGNNNVSPGEAIIKDVYLETYDDEGQKVYATFANPAPTNNATWNADTKTMGWTAGWSNQLRNIGLPSGDISNYKKLVVDCDIKSGEQFRVLFYKGGSNKTLYASNGRNEFILADTLKALFPDDYNEYLLACDEICLSGNNNVSPGEAVIKEVYLETYPENEQVDIPEITYEEDPGKPEGNFVDFTTAFPSLKPNIGLGTDGHPIVLGNGALIVGQRSKDVIADLSAYTNLTLVTSPNMKLVLYMNHEVEAQQNAGDYAEGDAGKYVFLDVQADENGIINVDLTQFAKQDLNCICLPWDNSNKGTVWYILLSATTFEPVDCTDKVSKDNWLSEIGNVGNYTKDVAQKEQYLTNTTTQGEVLYQTVEGLENGTYTVELYANASYTQGRGFATNANNGELGRVVVYAGDVEKTIPVIYQLGVEENNIVTLSNVVVSDGTLRMGLRKELEGSNWHTIQIKSLIQTSNKAVADEAAQNEYWKGVATTVAAYESYAIVIGVEKTNILAADTKVAAKSAIKAFYEAKAAYELLSEFIPTAETAGVDVTDAKALLTSAESSAEKVVAAYHALKLIINTKSVAGASEKNGITTNFVVNGTFDTQYVTSPWLTTTGARNQTTANNQSGAFGIENSYFFENWHTDPFEGKMYQVVEDIPNGKYILKIAAFVSNLDSKSQFVYANTDSVALTAGAPTAYEVNTFVTDNKVEVGFVQIAAVANWVGIDNVSLVYYGLPTDYTALNEAIAAAKTAAEALTNANAKAYLEAAIAAAEVVAADGEKSQAEVDAALQTLNDKVAAAQEAEAYKFNKFAQYAWESPAGIVCELGGVATYEHGDGASRVNYKNGDYYTICLNGKKGNLNDETASANAGYVLLTLDKPAVAGDVIRIAGYINKNESKKASAWIVFDNGTSVESPVFSDEANIDPAFGGKITVNDVVIPAEAAGCTSIKLTRGQTGTNLFITKLQILHLPKAINLELASGDITEALNAAKAAITEAGNEVGDINISLTAGASYTVSGTLTAPANFVLSSADGLATVVVNETMTDNFITLDGSTTFTAKPDGTDSDHKNVDMVQIAGIKLEGLQGALVRDNQKSYVRALAIINSVIEMPASNKNVLDFNGKGYVETVMVIASTIYAPAANTGFFAQYGSRPKNIDNSWEQKFQVMNSTFVNIANGKNINNLKQNGTAQNGYVIKNSIFVDCGKQNQVVVGFNNGQTSATPSWNVDGNIFNWGGADVSAAESDKAGKKDEVDIVQNSIAAVVTFPDAATGVFNAALTLAEGVTMPASVGDPRWTLTDASGIEEIAVVAAPQDGKFLVNGKLVIVRGGKQYNANGQLIK